MPRFDIVKNIAAPNSFREKAICGSFDIQPENLKETFVGDITIPDQWNIGVIYGRSGTGKSTIAKEIFKENYIERFEYKANSILDDMPAGATISDIEKTFTSVGFSSPPSWLKPYSVLSNGEKMRVDLARALLQKESDLIVFDEFTSVVDRGVAKIASIAISKSIKKRDKKFVAVACHDDILEWLEPDWVFCTNDMSFKLTRGLLPRLKIKIDIVRAETKSWSLFKKYHYMSGNLNHAAKCFGVSIEGDLVAFIGILPFPHSKIKNAYRVHRLVTLPDFQGIGIGKKLLEEVAQLYANERKLFYIVTSNPSLVYMLDKSEKWCLNRQGRVSKMGKSSMFPINYKSSSNKLTTSWKYIA